MSSRHRDFTAAVAEAAATPLTFTVLGETFTALPEAPAGVITDIIAANEMGVPDINRFFSGILVDEDVERFFGLIHRKDTVVTIDMLGQIITWLVEEYGGRPTMPSSPSGNGRLATGPSSTGSVSATA